MESPLRLESWAEPGSRRSPDGVLSELMLRAEPDSRRSPGRVHSESILLRTSAVGILYPTELKLNKSYICLISFS